MVYKDIKSDLQLGNHKEPCDTSQCGASLVQDVQVIQMQAGGIVNTEILGYGQQDLKDYQVAMDFLRRLY